ncbi:MAG: hypothetical protein NUW01_13510 [Gemmatimonadaceae bacterium]|nr:hypothetical protein [Gemmatimonadaceae bacterium]
MRTHIPIPKAEQTTVLSMTIPWRCGLCPTSFGSYDLSSSQDDPRRVACQQKRDEHMAEHKKVKA